jgi:DNA-binding response OmpR family regulator
LIRSRILSVSCDSRLLAARHRLLERAGFDVTSVGTTSGALDLLENHEYSAVVLGHSFSFTEKQLFTADVSDRWRIPVLVLHSGDEDFHWTGDATLEFTEGAAALVASLNSLVASRAKRSA